MARFSLAEVITAAQSGQVISFPTDTLPALAVQPEQAAKIYQLKQRPPEKPLILMAAHLDQLLSSAQGTAVERVQWQAIANQYWPGALTLVLPASDRLPAAVNPLDRSSIGLRIPDCAIARQILAETGPLATTSANRSGQPALLDPDAIAAEFPEVAVLAEDPWPAPSGLASTVVRWQPDGQWQVLRQGSIRLGEG
ncbi:L-threonylcarbamoyladenylate synthase [Synechococcus elongatus]|uniref:L-threonylcarbamoyladenylate synthase n=1 Tax=Synechococcus elongatus PCC 11801 TaxID=2219813 RepID=A0AAN1UUB1_SYNEL|nr:L-threonylcarbamoyladenylate synthase [Synechococcus elongatus]AZB72467.1 Sua5/YciO/YrdC/YwlC family protein [Synechococcus elongatus PCC 11801]